MRHQLVFHGTKLRIVEQNNNYWFLGSDISKALRLEKPSSAEHIYDRNSDEFTHDMSQVSDSNSSKNISKKPRLFSLHGAHLVATFFRTPIAKEFRIWVLDTLEQKSIPIACRNIPIPISEKSMSRPMSQTLGMSYVDSRHFSTAELWELVFNCMRELERR